MSSFVSTHVQSLLQEAQSSAPSTPEYEVVGSLETEQAPQEQKLYPLLLQLQSPLDKAALRKTLLALHEQQYQLVSGEDLVVRDALERRIVIGLYAEALDQFLKEAREAESEAEWWDSIVRSSRSVAWYLLATLPERIVRSSQVVLGALREHNLPIRPSSFSRQSLRKLFPSVGSLRPTALGTAFFPHLAHQPRLLFFSPLELTRQECERRREQLSHLRDERASQLGQLMLLKAELEQAIRENSNVAVVKFRRAIADDSTVLYPSIEGEDPIAQLHYIAFTQFAAHTASHHEKLASLRRPSRLTLLWPRLVFLPPVILLLFRTIYDSRESIFDSALQAHDTMKAFWFGYVVEPVRDILTTVRSGGDDATRIVNREAVRADIESLERMAVDLSRDKLSLNGSQIEQLSQQIHQGDFSPVLRIYEQDIKSPLRTALTGSLVRSLLIQIQKAKVDLDQALSGIDKLLKSQELTFAFVGVAPALAIVYASFNGLRTFWIGGRGGKRFGGRRERESAWLAMRRVERLLITSPSGKHPISLASSGEHHSDFNVPPLTSGLLLISVARLREFAEARLPAHSLLRSGILADIADLESPDFGRSEKLRIIDRMWRSWGNVLGWGRLGKL
ncbi:NCA2 [Sanghuangporus sanghuang]